MLSLTNFYDHQSFKKSVAAGQQIINKTPSGNETQLYNIGDEVITTSSSTIILTQKDNAIITDLYCLNGYYYYNVSIIKYGCKKKRQTLKAFRQKDLKLI